MANKTLAEKYNLNEPINQLMVELLIRIDKEFKRGDFNLHIDLKMSYKFLNTEEQ